MQPLTHYVNKLSKAEPLYSDENIADKDSGTAPLASSKSGLFTSLNCNRIALKCLKIKGNQFSESLMMMAVGSLLKWFDEQLIKPVQIEESSTVREITVFECIQYQRDAQSQSFTSQLFFGKSTAKFIPCQVTLSQLLPEQWMEAALTQAIAAVYLSEIKSNRAVYRRLVEETIKLIELDPRFLHLTETLLPCTLALNETMLTITHHLFPHGNASFEDLTLIWRNMAVYQQMINEENQLLRLFHLTRLQRFKEHRYNGKPRARNQIESTNLALVAVF
jgi:hypothetical protein